MDISLKHQIAERIIESNDDDLLNEIRSLVGLLDNNFWNGLPEEVKLAINEAKGELDRGEGTSHAIVMEEMKNRFLNR